MNQYIGKKVIFKQKNTNTLVEGVVQDSRDGLVKINGMWYEHTDIQIRTELGGGINESGNGGETLING